MDGRQVLIDETAATDGELLQRFAAARDEAAFGELLRRHGALVYGVCRRRLPQAADAEDALQATFLALARQARGMADRGTVAPWLHCVATRISGKLRRRVGRRKEAALPESLPDPARPGDCLLSARLDGEIARLPKHQRAAVLLCGVEGMSRRNAARLTGVPEGTFSARLSRGYAALRRRLGHLDPAAALGLAAWALPNAARAAAMDIAGDGGVEGAGIPAAVVRLAKGAMAMDGLRRIGTWTAAGLAALALGAAALMAQDSAKGSTADRAEEVKPAPTKPAAALDPQQLASLQAQLAKLDADRAKAAAQLAGLNQSAIAAFQNDPHAIVVYTENVIHNSIGKDKSAGFKVISRQGADHHSFSVDGIEALTRLAGWLAKDSPKASFVGFHSLGTPGQLSAARAVFQKAGFALVDLPKEPSMRTHNLTEMEEMAPLAIPARALNPFSGEGPPPRFNDPNLTPGPFSGPNLDPPPVAPPTKK